MKTLKNSIIAAVLTIGTLTIAEAQEATRKGWDGTIKGRKQTQGTTFGEKVSDETTSETQTALFASRKGYQYYKAQSDMAATSVKLSNNKHPDLMKRQSAEVSETVQDESDNKIKPTTTTTKKEYVGHVTILK